MADYITTYTGIRFYPTEPDPEGICIEDIAHALSLLCRGNGHVSGFWSVGQHCLLCAREAAERELSDRMILACLLHDASECYLSDVPRPFKNTLAGYREHEDRLLEMIYSRYLGSPLTAQEKQLVREIDDGALFYDLRELLHNEQSETDPRFHVLPDYGFRPFREVEQEYLELFYHFYGRLHKLHREEDEEERTMTTRAPERPVPDYGLLAEQLKSMAETERGLIPLLANASALLMQEMADVNWTGFYLCSERTHASQGTSSASIQSDGEAALTAMQSVPGAEQGSFPDLLLGPFQGRPACMRIAWGKGVCGTAAQQDRTLLVPDVHAFPGHIACDSASRSEIVVPIHDRDGRVMGVMDIDSPLKSRFGEKDRAGLEIFARALEECALYKCFV